MSSHPQNSPDPDRQDRAPLGGGAPLALLVLGGVIGGVLVGQPSLGLIIGLLAGIAAAIGIWLSGRRR